MCLQLVNSALTIYRIMLNFVQRFWRKPRLWRRAIKECLRVGSYTQKRARAPQNRQTVGRAVALLI